MFLLYVSEDEKKYAAYLLNELRKNKLFYKNREKCKKLIINTLVLK